MVRILSGTPMGVHALPIEVEVTGRSHGLPTLTIEGLTEGAARETKVRVLTALKNGEFGATRKVYAVDLRRFDRLRVNLVPSDVVKSWTQFDLPVALGVLVESGLLAERALDNTLVVGELSLDGDLRPVRGVLPFAVMARENGLKRIIVPHGNGREAATVEGLEVFEFRRLRDVVDCLRGTWHDNRPVQVDVASVLSESNDVSVDFSEIRGQDGAKRALEIAAAGGHNLLMQGPPGSGKTMLAKRLTSILPRMTLAESIETTKVYSVAGLLAENEALVVRRPYRAPHHTISDAGLVGGGNIMRPGEASLAHNGVLHLDELPEFKRHVLEALYQPLMDKRLTIARGVQSVSYPAGFLLVGSMNPCPCGGVDPCRCDPAVVQRYRARVGLTDRFQLRIDVPAVPYRQLAQEPAGETSATVRARVEAAREIQRKRFLRTPRVHTNAEMGPRLIRQHCGTGAPDNVLRVARTIADLDDRAGIEATHVAEAIELVCPKVGK